MAKPQIFLSSTFYDLRHIRASIEGFVERLGYEPVLSEKGKISYDPDTPLDESCYRGVTEADIFVLIVGGRYGSATSEAQMDSPAEFYDRYESITKKEYETAVKKDIPTYILVEKSVFSEFETYKKNRSNDSIEYAHVDSVNVFHLIEQILFQRKNNPIHQFDRYSDIEEWLREQWAGLFRELIHRRSEQKQLSSLSEKVDELSSINGSLQRYLETIVSKVTSSPDEADEIIKEEQEKVIEAKRKRNFEKSEIIKNFLRINSDLTLDDAIEIYTNAKSLVDLAGRVEPLIYKKQGELVEYWKDKKEEILEKVNEARNCLGLSDIPYD